MALHLRVFGRVVPVVNLDRPDQCRALDDHHVLGLFPVSVPGADKAATVILHGVEALDALEVEIVDEADLAAVIDRQVALDQTRFH